jgi:hypothetical protein
MQTTKIAQAVKDYLVALAVNDELPMDMTQLSVEGLEKAIQTALPSETDRQVSEAEHYLCDDDDMSTLEMIEAIADHEDQSDLIDNVEGVVVWEKVEGSITCQDFLEMIGY